MLWRGREAEASHRGGHAFGVTHAFHPRVFKELSRDWLLRFAHTLDPSFAPPLLLRSQDHSWTSNNGCGGGFEDEVWGDEQSGVRWDNTLTEHGAHDSEDARWSAYGLAPGVSVSIQDTTRSTWGTYVLSVKGPYPAVSEVAPQWVALVHQDAPRPTL